MRGPDFWNRVVDEVSAYQSANPRNLPGAVFAVETQHDGPLIASVGHGWSDSTICNIGSMTKPFTATAVLMALEEHDLLDPERFVWQLPGMDIYAHDEVKRQIRIKHLLQHSTGMPVFELHTALPRTRCNDPDKSPPCCPDPELDLGPTVQWIGSPGYTNECIFADGRCRPARTLSLDKVSSHIMETYPLLHRPGAQYSYSSANYIVAARIVEQLTGRSINLFLRDRLFSPARMRDSFFIAQPTGDPEVDSFIEEGVSHHQRSRVADVALITRDGRMPPEVAPGPDGGWDKLRRGWRFVYPDGGMYSTAADLLSYLRMLSEGGVSEGRRVLSRRVVRLLMEDQGFGHTMGFGYRAQVTPYGQGPGTIEHFGSKMTHFWYDPRPGNPLMGVFLSQRLPNIAVNMNISVGMKVIFRVFVSAVNSEIYGFRPNPA